MRLRNVKGSREMIATNDFVVHEEETMKGKWHDFFENENPIHIEVGMGKGRFIIDMAKLHPEINYIGIFECACPGNREADNRAASESGVYPNGCGGNRKCI